MKILVVEDQVRIAASIKQGLELKAHVVDVVHDGLSGLDYALSEPYDLIILDRMLPGLSGIEVCKQLRDEGSQIPILMLTAKVQTQDKVDGLDAGADDYLSKPFAFSELLARIHALARRPKKWHKTELTLGSLVANPSTGQVRRSNKEIVLSKKEFALLTFFLRNQNQVFTASQLTEKVWDFDNQVTANAAQVYVGYLRKKIDTPFSNEEPLLKTIRGFGYKMSNDDAKQDRK